MKLIRFFCMATLIALLFWIFPSNSIEVSLSSESGGNWATISSEYDADPDDSITEHAEASFMPVRVQSMRQASFSGNFHAEQTAFGSKGVSGGSEATATDASGSLTGLATAYPGCLELSQNANFNIDSTGEGTVYVFSRNSFPALEHDWSHGVPTAFTVVPEGTAKFLASKSDGILNAHTMALADEFKVDINAETNLEKNAIILEPYYWEFKTDMAYPPMNHPAIGSDGDTLSYYLSRNGYNVWWYQDSAVTKEKVLGIDDYRVALISSHMSSDHISLSRDDGNNVISDKDLKAAYQNPVYQPFVILDGCSSASTKKSKKSPLFEALQPAVASGGAIAGWEYAVLSTWSADSTGTIFEQLNARKSLGDANDYMKYTYGPYWIDYWKQRGYNFEGENQDLIIDGNLDWGL